MHIFAGGSKLQIARSQLSDGATYTCVASNVEGKVRKSYLLTVQGEWQAVSHPCVITVVRLTCRQVRGSKRCFKG